MRLVMVMFRSDGQRRSFSVTRDITVIGRREDCDLRIPLGDVSRKHCRLIIDGENIRVEDLGSSNGTYRNGERVQQTDLAAGDTLQAGPVVFVLQVDGSPADDELQPVTVQAAAQQAAKEKSAAAHDVTTTGTEEHVPTGEFDPMEALEANEGSKFDFQIDESSQHGTPIDLEEST